MNEGPRAYDPLYAGEMRFANEDGVVTLKKGYTSKGEWFVDARTNDEGGYISTTITEPQLRAMIEYIDRSAKQ